MIKEGRPHRRKVTFEWNAEDLSKIWSSLCQRETEPFKYFDLPIANYASSSYDVVRKGADAVGFSMFTGYSQNEKCGLSLGVVDSDVADGEVLTLVRGEEGGGTRKPTVERHRQCEVRVKVAPAPFSRDAREAYQQGWRTAHA